MKDERKYKELAHEELVLEVYKMLKEKTDTEIEEILEKFESEAETRI